MVLSAFSSSINFISSHLSFIGWHDDQEQRKEEKQENEEDEEEEEEDGPLYDSDDDDDTEEGRDSDEEEEYACLEREGYACIEKVPNKSGKLTVTGKKHRKKGGFHDDEEKPGSNTVLPSIAPAEKSAEENELDEIWDEMERGLDALASPFEEGRVSNEVKCGFGEVTNILLQHSIYDNNKGDVSRNANAEGRNSCLDMPLKFNFISPEPLVEKSEYERVLGAIWAEMECSFHVMQQENSPSASQPGNPCGKYDRRDSYTVDHVDDFVFDEFQDGTSGNDDYNHCNHKGTVWDVIPGVQKSMYPHQCEAFEFLWNNLAGGIMLDESKGKNGLPNGNGCIISHAPGSGKTRLTIVFLQTYMEVNPTCTPMIIAPKGMLFTWEEDLKKWKIKIDIPFHNLNKSEYSGNENEAAMNLVSKYGRNASTQVAKWRCRIAKLYSWKLGKSILGVSYKLFEQLTRQGSPDKDFRKFLLEQPGLLVLDEGHTPHNSQSRIWKSVTEIQTK